MTQRPTLYADPNLGPTTLIAGPNPANTDRLISDNLPTLSGSPLQHYELVMQGDGNLVIYLYNNGSTKPISGSARSVSNSQHSGATKCIMQADGNFVLYTPQMDPIWWPGKTGKSTINCGIKATMQADGNFVIYPATGPACWASGRGSVSIIDAIIGIGVAIYTAIIGIGIAIYTAVIGIGIATYRAIIAIRNRLSGIFNRRR